MDNIKLSAEMISEIEEWILKFPAKQKRSAVIAALTIVQRHNNGWLSQGLLDAVAVYLELPTIAVYEVATFYSMFELQPVGKYKICVCTNLSCMLCGCKEVVAHLKNKLDVDFGEVTKDGKFSLKEVECIAACDKAPVIEVNGKQFKNVTTQSVDEILVSLK